MTTRPSTAPGHAGLTGRPLGEWIVGQAIGSGGFADVYRARQPRLARDAVIKVLRLADGDPARRARFEAEARLACQLDHPYAAHVYSYGTEADGVAWIAMELVRGESLRDRIAASGPIPLAHFAPLFERLCEVVHSAHQVGLLHRDIKPANVMVIERSGRLLPKLLDFGIAEALGDLHAEANRRGVEAVPLETVKATSIEDGWTLDESIFEDAVVDDDQTIAASRTLADNDLLGTPAYMAPERWTNRAAVDHRSDVYSLGVLAHHCLSGALPFHCTSFADYAAAHASALPSPLGSEFPAALVSVVARAVAKNPDDRFASALELGQALRLAADPAATARLPRQLANTWLLLAPKPIRASLESFEAASPEDRAGRLSVLIEATAQWIGALAIAASVGEPGIDTSAIGALTKGELGPRDWLDIASSLCAPHAADPSRFPVPELVHWCARRDVGADRLLGLHALCRADDDDTALELGRVELLEQTLSRLEFLCEYSLVVGGSADPSEVWIADGDDRPLFALSPLVTSRPPTPGAAAEIFMIAGRGTSGALMRAAPAGFEIESAEVWPWLQASFDVGPDDVEEATLGRPPYRGLAPFTAEDAALFFGRNRDVQNLYNRVLAQPLVALTGPSGSGKSSIMHAGLAGRLEGKWTVVSLRPGPRPMAALAASLAALSGRIGEGDVDDLIEWLRASDSRVALLIDQAEELVTLAEPAEAEAFVSTLSGLLSAASERVRVVLTVRDDFCGRLGEIASWRGEFAASLLLVSPPNNEELRHMVVGPARRVGFRFDDETVIDEMVSEVSGQTGALPLLSFAASRLWDDRRRDERTLTRAAFDAMGGVGGALASYAEETLAALPTKQQASVRELFRQLVSGSGTRAWVERAELEDTCEPAVLEHLIRARILVSADSEDGGERIAVIHEALFSRWPRLVRWREQDAAGLRFRDDLRAAVAAWSKNARDPSYLWSGAALRDLETWKDRWASSFSEGERSFADASLANAKRARRRRRMITAAIVTILSVAIVFLLALNRRVRTAQVSADESFTDLLARRGYAELVEGHRQQALVYLHGAYRRGRDSPSMRLALALAQRGLGAERAAVEFQSGPVGISSLEVTGAAELVTSGSPAPVRRWRWADGQLREVAVFDHGGPHKPFVARGGEVATVGAMRLRLWDRDGSMRSETKLEHIVNFVHFVPDKEQLVTPWGDDVAVWDYDGRQVKLIEGGEPRRRWVWLIVSDDGSMVAAFEPSGSMRIWTLADGGEVVRLELGAEPQSAVFVPVSNRLFVGLRSGEIAVLDVPSGEVTRKRLHQRAVRFRLYADGSRLITESNGAPIRILDTASLEEVAAIKQPDVFASEANVVASPSGDILAVLDGSQINLVDGETLGIVRSLDVGSVVSAFEFSGDGETLLIGTMGGGLSAWNVRGRDVTSIAAGKNNKVWSADLSPDGKTVVVLTNTTIDTYDRAGSLIRSTVVSRDVIPFGMPQIRFDPTGTELIAPVDLRICGYDVATGLRVAIYSEESNASAGALGPRKQVATSSSSDSREESYISVFDRDSEQLLAERTTEDLARELVFTPDGRHIFYTTLSHIGLWDTATKTDVWSTHGHHAEDIDVSRDGALAVAGRNDAIVEIWRAATGEVYRTLRPPTPVTDVVSFSPSGSLLATGARDFSIYLWDIEAGVAIAALRGHSAALRNLHFSREDSLISTDRNGNVLVWKLDYEQRDARELSTVVDRLPFHLVGSQLVDRPSRIREASR